ncbi:hypothetical protein MMC26_002773 [Xylographa opegraphella]|nr:hypothetical protein [Xylographa opegraphella]
MRSAIVRIPWRVLRPGAWLPLQARPTCWYSSGPIDAAQIATLLSDPSWSVKSLLDNKVAPESDPLVTPKQLHHLLRLSALPLPKTTEEESKMIKTLESQLHFVRAIQRVDTAGVQPLQSIRDETEAAAKENEVTVESLQVHLDKEEVVGHSRRIKRRKDLTAANHEETLFNPLALASKKNGRYIVVETSKD